MQFRLARQQCAKSSVTLVLCTDVSTGGGNGETDGVSDEAAAAKGDNNGKLDPESQGYCPTLQKLVSKFVSVDVLTVDGVFRICACGPEPEVEAPAGSNGFEPSSWGFTCADLIKAHLQDPDLGFILQ
ncbi:hypothetical protein DPMN_087919 [Dreissena polymorpha]|uniref:Uncharacterized protein n=1 Tax=Dreissena polymorpha TaxID=45954 RepID=A0A9D4KUX7_DREPO|nr:hypothetical protein DPMN_087919 [Dreissena polymorpha]